MFDLFNTMGGGRNMAAKMINEAVREIRSDAVMIDIITKGFTAVDMNDPELNYLCGEMNAAIGVLNDVGLDEVTRSLHSQYAEAVAVMSDLIDARNTGRQVHQPALKEREQALQDREAKFANGFAKSQQQPAATEPAN